MSEKKTCNGCRYLFEDTAIDGKPHEFCRAQPPQMHIVMRGENTDYLTLYPLAPRVRCGQYVDGRRWWWLHA